MAGADIHARLSLLLWVNISGELTLVPVKLAELCFVDYMVIYEQTTRHMLVVMARPFALCKVACAV